MLQVNQHSLHGLPEEVIRHIISYTHSYKDKEHLIDIRSSYRDYMFVNGLFYYDETIYVTLGYICSRFIPYVLCDDIINIMRRHVLLKHKKDEEIAKHCNIHYHCHMKTNTQRKVRLLWGLFTPRERSRLVEIYMVTLE